MALTREIIENELYPIIEEKGYGFSLADCLHMIADHMEKDELTKEKIEFMLEYCNFHELYNHLHNGNYDYALNWVYNDYIVNA